MGIIATNYHVVDNAQEIKIVVKDGTEVKSYAAKVLVTDKTNDLALVSITDKEFIGVRDIPYSLYLDTKEVGTSIFSMGYPMSNILGGEVKITDGIINSKTGYEGDIATYQISSPIQPGNSGGALFDKNGVLIGITNAGVLSAQNVGYAIKATYLKNLIDAAPVYIDLPKGKNLAGRDLTDLVKILSPYIVLVEIY
ncbi:MAG: trypsin-like peptidase domain-containing protein [Paludibacteraceae bacterium]|nr:trypsin-like peptidase domain-containing protein [Paludibacteraceae bacterium]